MQAKTCQAKMRDIIVLQMQRHHLVIKTHAKVCGPYFTIFFSRSNKYLCVNSIV